MTTKQEALDQACLIAVTGSIAYGLNHANSDVDKMGVFIAPASEISGLDWSTHDNSWTNTSPEGDDLTMHEIGKYLRLALGGNPTLIELLFMNDYEVLDEVGQRMVDLRGSIISENMLRKSYYGYAKAQLERVRREDPHKPKMARHTLRIARQATDLLQTGTFNVKIAPEERQQFFDLTEMPKERMLEVMEKEVNLIKEVKSVIPMYADRGLVSDFLRSVRYDYP